MATSTIHKCPTCGMPFKSFFYEAMNVPINSCMLCSNHQEAVDFPKGEIVLGFCTKCGLISNVAFDPSKLDYSSLAPEEQGFSTTFNAFAQKLAVHLIETHNLHKKRILEIGCGRGDFLALICELGDNLGVGIDPSPVVGDLQDKVGERLKFIRDYYSERYGAHHGNLVCCRHTLEHVHNTADFLNSVRRGIGDSLETSVFFEVPDVTRILREVAFWDIYYEHCSYFSLGSLARLFRLSKFEVTSLVKDYFDQYLLIEGKPVNEKSEKILEVEDTIEQTAKDVEFFSEQCQNKLDWWKNKLRKIKVDKKRAIVWGSGSKCVAFMTTLGVEDEIEFVVDINPRRHGKFVPGVGKQIMAPEFLKEYKPDIVIVMNPAYSDEIKHTLDGMEIAAKLIPCS